MEKLDRIIKYIREEMVAGNGGFAGASDSAGPVAGFDPLIPGLRRRRDGKIDKRIKKLYKKWLEP